MATAAPSPQMAEMEMMEMMEQQIANGGLGGGGGGGGFMDSMLPWLLKWGIIIGGIYLAFMWIVSSIGGVFKGLFGGAGGLLSSIVSGKGIMGLAGANLGTSLAEALGVPHSAAQYLNPVGDISKGVSAITGLF